MPYLTGDGTTVVCVTSSYSAVTKRLTALWMAYSSRNALTRPRVIGSVTEPKNVTSFNGPSTVDWTNASGTEVIGSWSPAVPVTRNGRPATLMTNGHAYIGHGQVRPFPEFIGGFVTW